MISLTDPIAAEPSDPGSFTVTRSGSTGDSLTVSYTIGGIATSGSDYSSPESFITIPAGSSSATIIVSPIDDMEAEGDETVTLTITPSLTYNIGTPSTATVTIVDNDSAPLLPTVTISATDPTAAEPSDPGSFTVTRSGSTSAPLILVYSIGGTATAGSDYSFPGTSITIPAGSSSASIIVSPIDDTAVEGNETITLTIIPVPSYTIGDAATATVTITDNDSSVPQGAVTLHVIGEPTLGPYAVAARTTVPGNVRVEFFVNGSLYRTESTAPFSLFGDYSWGLFEGNLGPGSHTIAVRVYQQNGTQVLAQTQITVIE
jgi:hypothetical protein